MKENFCVGKFKAKEKKFGKFNRKKISQLT